jgi:hypothetical protein
VLLQEKEYREARFLPYRSTYDIMFARQHSRNFLDGAENDVRYSSSHRGSFAPGTDMVLEPPDTLPSLPTALAQGSDAEKEYVSIMCGPERQTFYPTNFDV